MQASTHMHGWGLRGLGPHVTRLRRACSLAQRPMLCAVAGSTPPRDAAMQARAC